MRLCAVSVNVFVTTGEIISLWAWLYAQGPCHVETGALLHQTGATKSEAHYCLQYNHERQPHTKTQIHCLHTFGRFVYISLPLLTCLFLHAHLIGVSQLLAMYIILNYSLMRFIT